MQTSPQVFVEPLSTFPLPMYDDSFARTGIVVRRPRSDVAVRHFQFQFLHRQRKGVAVARRMGMQQSLLAQYIRGNKRPSAERAQAILKTVQEIGKELSAVSI